MEEARIVKLLQNFWDFDTFPLVAPPAGYSVCAFTAGVLSRFSNPAIRDQLLRVAHDGAAKIMVFLAGAVIPDPGSEIWAIRPPGYYPYTTRCSGNRNFDYLPGALVIV
jgi:hypothetical protein